MQHNKLTDYLKFRAQYTFNTAPFETYLSNHRAHQTEAINAACNVNIGQILSPCGTGKTRIQIGLHLQDMINKTTQGTRGVYVIASHRLTLNAQLLDPLVCLAIECGLPFDILFIGSGRPNLIKYYQKYFKTGYDHTVSEVLSSTNKKEIEAFIATSRANNRHVIISSTYHSIDQLENITDISLITYDEAHNTTERKFTDNITKIKPNIKKEYFFTATRKVSGVEDGMNNRAFYGEVIFDAFPNMMLQAGEIVCPMIHVIDSVQEDKTTSPNNINMLIKNIIEGYEFHKQFIFEKSADPTKITPKLLVSFAGIKEMDQVYSHPSFISYAINNGISIFSISSEGSMFQGDKCNKETFMAELNKLDNSKPAIIFNVDMLTEGIDLPSITGVMPLRNMALAKLLQLLGRALRLCKEDREALYSGKLAPTDYKNYVKPYGWLIIPRHLASVNEHQAMINSIKTIINEYKTPAEQIVIQEKFRDQNHDDLNSVIPYHPSSGSEFDLIHSEMDIVSKTVVSLLDDALNKQPSAFHKKKLLEALLNETTA